MCARNIKKDSLSFSNENGNRNHCTDNICDLYWFSHKRGKKRWHIRDTLSWKNSDRHIINCSFRWPRIAFGLETCSTNIIWKKKNNQKLHFVFNWNEFVTIFFGLTDSDFPRTTFTFSWLPSLYVDQTLAKHQIELLAHLHNTKLKFGISIERVPSFIFEQRTM